MKHLTTKESAELRRLDRKITDGKASRREIERGIELKRRKGAARAISK